MLIMGLSVDSTAYLPSNHNSNPLFGFGYRLFFLSMFIGYIGGFITVAVHTLVFDCGLLRKQGSSKDDGMAQ